VPLAHGGTLPSKSLPVLEGPGGRRGVAPMLVALLVLAALIAGFVFGWAVGHTT